MKNKNSNKPSKTRKVVLFIALVILAVAIGGLALYARNRDDKHKVIAQPGGPVQLAPPTKQESDEANNRKDQIVKQQKAIEESNNQTGKKQVSPVITYVDQNGLNAYIAGVFEDGGTCTAVLSQGTQSFDKTSSSYKDATTTGCQPIDFSSDEFPSSGTWTAIVNYESPLAKGTSKAVTFTVK